MSIVIGQIGQIMTRSLSIDILNARSWDCFIHLSDDSLDQLHFWKENLEHLNRKHLFDTVRCSKVVYSDASNSGFAGYEVSTFNGVAHGLWSIDESSKSSTWKELTAVFRVICSLTHIFSNQSIKWFSDNQGVTSIVRKGSMNKELQSIAIQIFKICMSKSIQLFMEWIPRSFNERADYLSKVVDYDDWGISNKLLFMIKNRFGHLSVDWFASEHNAKLVKFYSRFWSPSSSGVDAFTENWGFEFGLFVPPISLIGKVIRKMSADQAVGVLVVPCWPSAIFWPDLCPNGNFISNVSDWFDLPTNMSYYTACSNGKGLFGNADLKFRMLALNLNFRHKGDQRCAS
jgi:hypothetical protein